MIGSMKRLNAEPAGTAQDESRSVEFERLFLEHWASVYRVLHRLVGDPAEAEDLALETFLRLYRQTGRQPDGLQAGGWLYRVATRLGLRSIRSWKRRERHELTAGRYALEESEQDSPAEILARQEERQQVRLVLSRMNERQSQILILRHSGLSYREIAEALGLTAGSIGPLLVRAEREFEKQYRALAQEA
jgi:RNA polymerase sigma-70 factor (ECF subfamily)